MLVFSKPPVFNKEGGTGGVLGALADDQNSDDQNNDDQNTGENNDDNQGEEVKFWLDTVDGITEDEKAFVGERDPRALIEYARQQRRAASKTADTIAEDAEEELVLKHMERYRPKEADTYRKIMGYEEDQVSPLQKAEFEAANAVGMHPQAFKAYKAAMNKSQADIDEASVQEAAQRINDKWGDEKAANLAAIDRYFTQNQFPPEFAAAISSPGSGLSAKHHEIILDAFLIAAKNQREPGDLNNTGETGGKTAEEELGDLIDKAKKQDLTSAEGTPQA